MADQQQNVDERVEAVVEQHDAQQEYQQRERENEEARVEREKTLARLLSVGCLQSIHKEGRTKFKGPLVQLVSQRLLLLWGVRFPEEVEVTFSAPENRAKLDATIYQKDSVIEEVGQSSESPEPAAASSPNRKRRKLFDCPYCKPKKSFTDDDKLAQHLSFAHMFD